jgi:hypothetical protein
VYRLQGRKSLGTCRFPEEVKPVGQSPAAAKGRVGLQDPVDGSGQKPEAGDDFGGAASLSRGCAGTISP